MTALAIRRATTTALAAPAGALAEGHRPVVPRRGSPVHLFSRRGRAALAGLAGIRSVLVFDMEGVLVPGRCAGGAATGVEALTAARLRALNRMWPVAVIARTSSADACLRLGFEPSVVAHCAAVDHGSGRAPDKAGALEHILRESGMQSALIVGGAADDDRAFAVAPTHSLTVRIGPAAQVPTAAAYWLETQSQVTVLLSMLLALRQPRLGGIEQTGARR